jgi:hypothetical protein
MFKMTYISVIWILLMGTEIVPGTLDSVNQCIGLRALVGFKILASVNI